MARPEIPDVSIVIIGWKRAPELLDCLEAVNATVDRAKVEVILTLNEPDAALLAELDAQSHLYDERLTAPLNQGYATANNIGAEAARGRYLMLLNDDAIVTTGWLDPLVARLEADPTIGAVGPACLAVDGEVVEVGCWLSSEAMPSSIVPVELKQSFTAGPVPYASASALLVRRAQFLELGGLDPGYFPAYFEDSDYAFKLLDQGYSTWLEPAAEVIHSHAESGDRRYAMYLVQANRHRFVSRWAEVLTLMPPTVAAGDPSERIELAIEAVKRLAANPRCQGPAVPDVTTLTPELAQRREVEIFHDYVAQLVATLDELERREQRFQVLVAERDHMLNSVVPEIERELIETRDELAAYRSRKIVLLLDGVQRSRARLRKLAGG